MPPEIDPKTSRMVSSLMEIFGLSRAKAFGVVVGGALLLFGAIFWFVCSAPPRTLILTTGTPDSMFQTNAEHYSTYLAKHGITLKILPSLGSAENLRRLNDPKFRVDVGFVQDGVTNDPSTNTLVSLGSISYEPLLVFCRAAAPIVLLKQMSGKRVAVGPVGSATRALALTLLDLNSVKAGGATVFSDYDAPQAAKALLAGTVDVAFMMGDSASPAIIHQLLNDPTIQIVDFMQADGYTRRITYLNKLVLPRGSIDFGKDLPSHDVNLVGPTVELVARPGLHPALIDLLLQAARKWNGKPGLMKRQSEFPTPLEHDFPISPAATRYYKTGASSFYSALPFWLSSRVNMLVVFVPLLVVLFPTLRFLPIVFKLQMKLFAYRWYRELLSFERALTKKLSPEKRAELLAELDRIEEAVNHAKVPPSFADQFYGLRGHILIVRKRLIKNAGAGNV